MNINNDTLRIINEPKPTGKTLKANGGTFYAGMTLQEAQKIGRDKCFFRRDFRNLDKDEDGILSKEEVMKEREREAKVLLADSIIMGLFSLAELRYFFKGPQYTNAVFSVLAGACSLSSFSSYKNKVKLNEELKKEFFA